MRFEFITSSADVHLDDSIVVDREESVRVDSHTKETRVGVDDVRGVSHAKIVQHRRRAQVSQLSAILHTIKLRWVHTIGICFVQNAVLRIIIIITSFTKRLTSRLSAWLHERVSLQWTARFV